MSAIPVPDITALEPYIERVATTRGTAVEAILAHAKAVHELWFQCLANRIWGEATFQRLMLERFGYDQPTCSRWNTIGKDTRYFMRQAHKLPPNFGTLAELASLPSDEAREAALAPKGADTKRADVREFKARSKAESKSPEAKPEPKSKPLEGELLDASKLRIANPNWVKGDLVVFNYTSVESLNPGVPSRKIDSKIVADIAESVKQFGFLQPIIIVMDEGKGYRVIAGFHRYAAFMKLITEADDDHKSDYTLPTRMVFVTEANEEALQISENLHRNDLTASEPDTLPKTAQQKFDRLLAKALTQQKAEQEKTYWNDVNAKALEVMPDRIQRIEKENRELRRDLNIIQNGPGACITKDEFRKLRAIHPDQHLDAEKRDDLFAIIMKLEPYISAFDRVKTLK